MTAAMATNTCFIHRGVVNMSPVIKPSTKKATATGSNSANSHVNASAASPTTCPRIHRRSDSRGCQFGARSKYTTEAAPTMITTTSPMTPRATIWNRANESAPPRIRPGPSSNNSDAGTPLRIRVRITVPNAAWDTTATLNISAFQSGTSR